MARMNMTVSLLREAAGQLRAVGGGNLILPDFDEESPDESYPLALQPGSYRLAEVAEALQFIADMLEM